MLRLSTVSSCRTSWAQWNLCPALSQQAAARSPLAPRDVKPSLFPTAPACLISLVGALVWVGKMKLR